MQVRCTRHCPPTGTWCASTPSPHPPAKHPACLPSPLPGIGCFIELLTPAAQWIRRFASDKTLLGGNVRFTGGARPFATSPAHANVARFQRIIDAIGVPEDVSVERCTSSNLAVQLLYSDEVSVGLDCQMEEGLDRHLEIVLEFDKGIVRQQDRRIFVDGGEVELTPSEGLFLTDQLAATASILDGTESYIPMEQILDGLSVADLVMGVS